MAALFTAASSQYLVNTTIPTAVTPFSVGFWAYINSTTSGLGARKMFASSAAAVGDFIGQTNFSGTWQISPNSGAPTTGGVQTANQWAYFVGRFITATNRKLSVLQFDGSIATITNTTNNAITPDRWALGAAHSSGSTSEYFDGRISGYWATNIDIQADAADLNNDTLRQLAYCGPFSIPHVAANLIDYREMDQPIGSDTDMFPTAYMPFGQRTWTNSNGVTRAEHPPLRPDYKLPNNIRKLGIV